MIMQHFNLDATFRLCCVMKAADMYPSVQMEEYPAEGGTLVACHGGLAQEDVAAAPARLQPFCETWQSYAAAHGNDLSIERLTGTFIDAGKWLHRICFISVVGLVVE